MSGAGPEARRRVQQPSGSRGHSLAGHCSRNSLGVSIFSVQRTGLLYGSGNKAASVSRPRRGGGGRGEGREPRQEPRTEAGPGFPGAPHPPCFQGRGEIGPSGRQGARGGGPLGAPAPPAQGRPGRGSTVRPAPPRLAHKHLLSAVCVPRFSGPQGAATKTLPKCTSAGGGREGERRDQKFPRPGQAPEEEQAEADPWKGGASPSLTLGFRDRGWGGREKDGGFSSSLGTSLRHRPQSSPKSMLLHRVFKQNRTPALPSPQSLWGTLGPVMKASLSHHMPLMPWPDLQAASLLPAIPQADPTAWNAHSPPISSTQPPIRIPPGAPLSTGAAASTPWVAM